MSTGFADGIGLGYALMLEFPGVTSGSAIYGVELSYGYGWFGYGNVINRVACVRQIVGAGLAKRLTHELNRLIITYLDQLLQNL